MSKKELLYLVAGLGLGYAIAKQRLEQVYYDRNSEEIKAIERYYKDLYSPKDKGTDESTPEESEAVTEAVEALLEASEGGEEPPKESKAAIKALTDYQGMSSPTKPAAVRPKMDPKAKPPYTISFENFDATQVGFEKISLTYFAGDDVLADVSDEVLSAERVEQCIGLENMKLIAQEYAPEVTYVRCERFSMDFEVTREAGSYSGVVQDEEG